MEIPKKEGGGNEKRKVVLLSRLFCAQIIMSQLPGKSTSLISPKPLVKTASFDVSDNRDHLDSEVRKSGENMPL